MTNIELGDNLVHLLQLLILATVCVLLAIFTNLDKTALVALFFGPAGILATVHLININTTTALQPVPTTPAASALEYRPTPSTTTPAVDQQTTQPHMPVVTAPTPAQPMQPAPPQPGGTPA